MFVMVCAKCGKHAAEVGDTELYCYDHPWADLEQKQISAVAVAMSMLGQKKSAVKTAAARANGKKGGRPRKPKPDTTVIEIGSVWPA